MLGIDISALSLAELRQLLEVARARGQHKLAEQLSAELQARPGRSARWSAPQPLSLSPEGPAEPAPTRRRGLAVAVAGVAAGVVAGALVWGVGEPQPSPSLSPLKVSTPRVTVAIARPDPTPVEAAPAELPAAEPAATEPAAPAPASRPLTASPGRNPCYDLGTPADRLVCGYPSLGQRERRLQAAYRAAVAAGADPQALEAEEAAWKAGRDGISDRVALADLYDKRIRELSETVQ